MGLTGIDGIDNFTVSMQGEDCILLNHFQSNINWRE